MVDYRRATVMTFSNSYVYYAAAPEETFEEREFSVSGRIVVTLLDGAPRCCFHTTEDWEARVLLRREGKSLSGLIGVRLWEGVAWQFFRWSCSTVARTDSGGLGLAGFRVIDDERRTFAGWLDRAGSLREAFGLGEAEREDNDERIRE